MRIIILSVLLLLTASYSMADERQELMSRLDKIEGGDVAMCRMKDDSLWFICSMNKRNYYNCRIGLAGKFTLKKCEPVACAPCKTETVSPVAKGVSNPLLDLFLKK